MNKEMPLRIGLVFMVFIFSVFIWLQKADTSDNSVASDIKTNVSGLFSKFGVNFSKALKTTGLSEEIFCPFINPYMSELFSAGSLEVDNNANNPLFVALTFSIDHTDCNSPVSATFDYDTNKYTVICGAFSKEMTVDELADKLNQSISYLRSEGLSDFGLSANDKMPGWQCFFFFGILPFIALYFFLLDILGFTMFSPRLKVLITLLSSSFAIMTGVFARFIWQLSYIAALGIKGTFLLVIVFLSFLSLLMSWIGSIGAATGDAYRQTAELGAGMAEKYTFKAISKAFEEGNKGK